jgi:hypothetical protein
MTKNHRARIINRLIQFCATLLAVVVFLMPALAQVIDDDQLSKLHLSKPVREQFVNRFKQFIEDEEAHAYDKQFDLLAKDHLGTLLHMSVDRESYVRFKQENEQTVGDLIEIRVKRVTRNPNNPKEFVLSVIAKLRKGQREYSANPICVAYYMDGNWRFSLLYVEY